MSACNTHASHDHVHMVNCGHLAIVHGSHVDYVHDGHLHAQHGDHFDECSLETAAATGCTKAHHGCGDHDAGHRHTATCGHPAVPHGDHVCYVVDNHLHFPCADGHCDSHGAFATACTKHSEAHDHVHGANCGHTRLRHEGHWDYLHDGHLHHVHGDHVDDHFLPPSSTQAACGSHKCASHDAAHVHGANCGHQAFPHDGHVDYLVDSHLHHPCASGHCDDHGAVVIAF